MKSACPWALGTWQLHIGIWSWHLAPIIGTSKFTTEPWQIMIGNRNPDYRNPWFCSKFCMVLLDFCVSCVKSLAFGLLQFALGSWPFAIAIGNLQFASGPWPPGIGQWKFAPEPSQFMIGTRNPHYRSLGFF